LSKQKGLKMCPQRMTFLLKMFMSPMRMSKEVRLGKVTAVAMVVRNYFELHVSGYFGLE
jgi:hypothetical protein